MNQPAKEGSVRQRILDLGEPRLFYAAFLLLLIGFFLYSIQSVLTPVVVFAAMLLLLSPFAGSRAHTLLVFTSGALTLLWLFAALGSLLAPFVLAFVLTYILNPGVTALQRRGIDSRLIVFPDENHWVLKPRNSEQWHTEVFGWLDKYLKPAE